MTQTLINKHFFQLLLFTLLFGILLYDAIGFDYTDEICALLLFVFFCVHVFSTPDWNMNKGFLVTIGIFLFYVCYSFCIGSNTQAAILSDTVIQLKPYLAFFCVYSLAPRLDEGQRRVLRSVSLLLWLPLLAMGIISFGRPALLLHLMGHPTYYAAAVICVSLCYLYASEFTTRDKILFIALLSIGLISGRSKFYGFFTLTTILTLYFSDIKQFRLNARNLFLLLAMLATILFVAKEKIYFYFYQTLASEIDKDMVARYVLYSTTPSILVDYFPFGSGFASYGTFSSGVYYSDLYTKYGIDNVWGMSKDHYNFIADTYYPSLAQFGMIGIALYISFWIYVLRKAFSFAGKAGGQVKCLILVLIVAGFFLIEGTTDSTFTTHRGFFVLMLLGLALSDLKHNQALSQNINPVNHSTNHEDTSNQ